MARFAGMEMIGIGSRVLGGGLNVLGEDDIRSIRSLGSRSLGALAKSYGVSKPDSVAHHPSNEVVAPYDFAFGSGTDGDALSSPSVWVPLDGAGRDGDGEPPM